MHITNFDKILEKNTWLFRYQKCLSTSFYLTFVKRTDSTDKYFSELQKYAQDRVTRTSVKCKFSRTLHCETTWAK